MIKRCSWVEGKEEIYIRYHDDEWGIAKYDDDILFEMLVLESFQAGLSWITILKKRKSFKTAFDDFNLDKIINYDDDKVRQLLENEKIIRHEGKIRATINNAKVFKVIQKEYGSFSNYIWGFTDGVQIVNDGKLHAVADGTPVIEGETANITCTVTPVETTDLYTEGGVTTGPDKYKITIACADMSELPNDPESADITVTFKYKQAHE